MQIELLDKGELDTVLQAIAITHGQGMVRHDLIQKVIKLGHESVLEHYFMTFRIEGISRVTSHQLVRHRIASFSQRSQRYCDEGDQEFIAPPTMPRKNENSMESLVERSFAFYQKLVDDGVPKEDARYFLYQGTATDIIVTMNARELRHFFKLRLSKDAQWEIREMAQKMLRICMAAASELFEDIQVEG